MKKTCFIMLFLLVLTSVNALGYVVLYPGVEFYNDDLTIGFSNSDGINVSYLEVGDGYVNLGDLNLSMSFSGALEVNVSQADSGVNLAVDTTVLRFNATHSSGSVTFTFTGNHSNAIYSLYRDSVFVSQHEASSFSWTQSSWSTHDFEIELDSYRPDCPTSDTSSYDVNSQTVNISWNNANYADYYVVMRRNDTYPSSRSDSSAYQVQNDTILYYNTSLTTTAYFSVWSYNSTTNTYSLNSCKLDAEWGAISIYAVYNESNASQAISPFGVLISNVDGTESYTQASVSTTPWYISKDDIPFGDNTILVLNATGYKTTRYYFDYAVNNFYNHTLYMPPVQSYTPGEGDDPTSDDDDEVNYTTTRLYRIRVIDQYTYPISDAKINVKRYINTTDQYENTSVVITDGYGEADVYLVPNVNYKIIITKENYEQVGSRDWVPDPVFYGANYPKTFQMEYDDSSSTDKGFWDVIDFNATMYGNNSLRVCYEDSDNATLDTKFETFELFNFSSSLISTNTTTTSDSFCFWVTGINNSRTHQITLHLNHTYVGWKNVTITVEPYHTPSYDKSDIENKAVGVFGSFDLGYVNFFFIFLPVIILLVVFGPRHAGMGVIGAGLYMGFTSIFIEVPDAILALVPLVVAIGFILIIVKEGGIKL